MGKNILKIEKAATTSNFTMEIKNIQLFNNLFLNEDFSRGWEGWRFSQQGEILFNPPY